MSNYDNWKGTRITSASGISSMNWKSVAGNAANRAKDYVTSKEYKNTYDNISSKVTDRISRSLAAQNLNGEEGGSSGGEGRAAGLKQWARHQIQARKGYGDRMKGIAVEKVHIFPGWAVRRYRKREEDNDDAPFDVDIFVSGYASSTRPPELATRSQKVFMQLAKRFAALPKLPAGREIGQFTSNQLANASPPKLSKSTEDLLKSHPLPATPDAMTEEKEMAILEAKFQQAEEEIETDGQTVTPSDSPPPSPTLSAIPIKSPPLPPNADVSKLTRLHANLNARLEPFWSSVLPNRTVRLSAFASPPTRRELFSQARKDELLIDFLEGGNDKEDSTPLVTRDVITSPQGDFQSELRIPWEKLCRHPKTLQIAFDGQEPPPEYLIFVLAELLPAPVFDATSRTHSQPQIAPTPSTESLLVETSVSMKLSSARMRVISDVDDTIKVSDILGGAKAVFQNVFVSELEALVIRGMSEWYRRMWNKGVRFHYVSNSPFELLPVINEFIHVSELPEGSVKLRSYSGRSLFNGLLSSPSVRKRSNVVDVLNNFLESQFILIGDSGEQDLELYSSLARERPQQIVAIFIRDVSTTSEPLSDPTGSRWQQGLQDDILNLFNNPNARPRRTPSGSSFTTATPPPRVPRKSSASSYRTRAPPPPPPRRGTSLSQSADPFRDPSPQIEPSSMLTEEPTPLSRPDVPVTKYQSQMDINARLQNFPLPTRQRIELQMRVNRARDETPSHIRLRIFKDPLECTEAEEILDRYHM